VRAIVCGGRDYSDRDHVFAVLDASGITYLIEGGAPGADRLARSWAISRGVPHTTVKARWFDVDRPGAVVRRGRYGLYDAAAGAIRNGKMLDLEPERVVAFPGGTGTANMIEQARAAGVPVEVIPRPTC
jgi:hypothetical protein